MNSRIIKKSLKKKLLSLSFCLLTAITLVSCSSTNSREVAQQQGEDYTLKSDVAKIESDRAPHFFHSKRFEKYNQY